MARTLIGQLILRLRAEGLGEAKQVVTTMKDIENAARNIGRTGVGSWGIGFQKQLNGLKLAQRDIDAVQRSWVALHDSMKSRNLSSALKAVEVSHWKTNTISELGKGRAQIDRELNEIEKRFKGHFSTMKGIFKAGLVTMGAYTLPYFGGMMVGESLSASSERRREIFRQQMAGISEEDQNKLFAKSEEISQKYPSLPITTVMEMSRNAYSVMGDGDRAAAVLERMAQAFVVLQSAKGLDAAVSMLIGLIRGFDNLGVNADGQRGVDQVNELIEATARAAQVDPDYDPGKTFEFAKAAKVAGPALSMDFLARTPVFMQDMGSGAAGNALAMAFKGFVLEAVGSAGGKRYLAERDRIGIRKNGKLVDWELFGSDPDRWVLKHLVPALQRDGVDLNNDTQVAAAVGKLSGNTVATGFLTRVITQREQIARWLGNMDKSMGLEAAENVRFEDPFVGWTSFKKSLENLSAALVPIDSINAGLNSLADGINALAAAAKDNPLMTALGLGGAGLAAYKVGKGGYDLLTDGFGLKSSAVALDGSAAALTRAAAVLSGQSVVDGAVGEKAGKPGGRGRKYGLLGLAAALLGYSAYEDVANGGKERPDLGGGAAMVGLALIPGFLGKLLAAISSIPGGDPGNEYLNASDEDRAKAREEVRNAAQQWNDRDLVQRLEAQRLQNFAAPRGGADPGVEDRLRSLDDFLSGPSVFPDRQPTSTSAAPEPRPTSAAPATDTTTFGYLRDEAARAGQEVKAALEITAAPSVNTAALERAVNLAREFLGLMKQVSTTAAGAGNSAAELRRGMADYGVAP